MRGLKAVILAAAIPFALSACAPGPSAADTAADEAALKAETQTYIAAYNAGDVEKIVALFG